MKTSQRDDGFLEGMRYAATLARKIADNLPRQTTEHTWSRCNHGAIEALTGLAEALDVASTGTIQRGSNG